MGVVENLDKLAMKKYFIFFVLFTYVLVGILFSDFVEGDDRVCRDLSHRMKAFFSEHETEVRLFAKEGGHLPDECDPYFFIVYEKIAKLSSCDEGSVSIDDIRFFRYQLGRVAIISSLSEVDVSDKNKIIEDWVECMLALDEVENELVACSEE